MSRDQAFASPRFDPAVSRTDTTNRWYQHMVTYPLKLAMVLRLANTCLSNTMKQDKQIAARCEQEHSENF